MQTSCAETKDASEVTDPDLLLAMKLQAEFDLEAKYNFTTLRCKGSDGEYCLRARATTSSQTWFTPCCYAIAMTV